MESELELVTEEERKAFATRILEILQTHTGELVELGAMIRSQQAVSSQDGKIIRLHQEAIEAWGERLQALERQVQEIVRVMKAPRPSHGGGLN